jgi:hypothetical protein
VLQTWLKTLEHDHRDRLLRIDLETCRLWGELTATAQKAGRVVHATDGLIAATALQQGLRIITRNTTDFEPTGVALPNHWEGLACPHWRLRRTLCTHPLSWFKCHFRRNGECTLCVALPGAGSFTSSKGESIGLFSLALRISGSISKAAAHRAAHRVMIEQVTLGSDKF